MAPSTPMLDVIHTGCGNAKSLGNVRVAMSVPNKGADGDNLLGGQLGSRNLFTFSIVRPASLLLCHISHVVGLGAEEKMVGTNADWVVAVMADKEAVRDRAVRQFVGNAVRERRLPVANNDAISISVTRALPNPARIRLADALPEALRVKGGLRLVVTRRRAVLAASTFDDPGSGLEGGAANKTIGQKAGRLGGHILNLLHRFGSAVPQGIAVPLGLSRVSIIPENRITAGISEVSP